MRKIGTGIICVLAACALSASASAASYPDVKLRPGDMDGDSVINVSDARLALRAAVGLEQPNDEF